MPRGPGKRENYNLDYSRFNYLDKDGDEVVAVRQPEAPVQPAKEAEGGPMPDFRDVMRTLPTELQEAFHLMQIARQTGDQEAQRKANELALKAVENGGPQVKQQFLEHLAGQNPELAEEMGYIGPETAPIEDRIDKLRAQMEKGKEDARKQMEALNKQQESLESMKSPEDIMKFMAEGGMTMEDMQRMFSGDQSFMEEKMKSMLDKHMGSDGTSSIEKTAADADKAVKATEVLHGSLLGSMDVNEAETKIQNIAAGKEPAGGYKQEEKKKPTKPAEPPKPTVKVADYRLQYQKDEAGKYTGVELKVSLPGVEDFSSVVLDISAEHLRLSTVAPAPAYVVNAGPFPVCIDANNAKAKFSKKKQELSVSVPAETNR